MFLRSAQRPPSGSHGNCVLVLAPFFGYSVALGPGPRWFCPLNFPGFEAQAVPLGTQLPSKQRASFHPCAHRRGGGPRLCPCPFTPCFAVSVCLYNTHICTREHLHTRTRAHTQDDSNSMRASEGEVGHAGEGCFSLFPCVFISRAEHVTGCPGPAPRAAFLRVTTTWRTSRRRPPSAVSCPSCPPALLRRRFSPAVPPFLREASGFCTQHVLGFP